ncbi:MAG: GNAT family N-acetyltransferase [Acidobacteriota bacterium]|nr:GNAT family N-acetyltransferase [Acidobacteriota bacterium]MDH3528444.1 GNAT family N-acetyltransferase [Acidobacteriota bacterium]
MKVVKNVEKRFEHTAIQTPIIAVPDMKRLEALTNANTAEVTNFLKIRPVHTVVMSSFIQDNGLESELNRGIYYGYRSETGELQGVALIGHSTLIEARSEEALTAFAMIARTSETAIHLMMSDGNAIERFWTLYKQDGSEPRLKFTEKLFDLKFPYPVQECEWDVRLADKAQIEQIAEAHAEVAFLESGVDPMEKDPQGFIKRCLRRIEQKRTFVVFENNKLVFKADIAAETDDVIYLEGVYVSPEYRGRSVGSTCMSRLGSMLLSKVENICLLTNLEFKAAHRCFEKAGFNSTDECTTIFV